MEKFLLTFAYIGGKIYTKHREVLKMRALYIANDGKEFSTEEACKEYEKELNTKYYETLFKQGTLEDRVEKLIEKYNKFYKKYAMDCGGWRIEHADNCFGEYEYGVVFVRDDVVNLLIERIRELEADK